MTTTEPSVATLDDALQAIRSVRLEVAELRGDLANEVRTRRLVVVDAQGREVIYSAVGADGAEWYVTTEHDGVEHDTFLSTRYSEVCGAVKAGVHMRIGSQTVGSFVTQAGGHSQQGVENVPDVDVALILPRDGEVCIDGKRVIS